MHTWPHYHRFWKVKLCPYAPLQKKCFTEEQNSSETGTLNEYSLQKAKWIANIRLSSYSSIVTKRYRAVFVKA